jgi:hypothetical protein
MLMPTRHHCVLERVSDVLQPSDHHQIATVGFSFCRLTGGKISVAYLLIALAVLTGVFCDTWFGLRLRWYEFYQFLK